MFVKVDGRKTEVSPEDRVQKILNTDWDGCVTCEGRILKRGDKMKSCRGSRREHSVGHEQNARRIKTQGQEGQRGEGATGRWDVCDACEQMRSMTESVNKA